MSSPVEGFAGGYVALFAIALLISGAAIGMSDPIAIMLIALGMLLVILLRSRSGQGPNRV
jgi:hypothetical protein